jgi:hypothetical protein
VSNVKNLILSSALTAALCMPALAMGGNWGGYLGGHNQGGGGNYRGVPGPIAGAGILFIAAGCGVYWLIRRRGRTPE